MRNLGFAVLDGNAIVLSEASWKDPPSIRNQKLGTRKQKFTVLSGNAIVSCKASWKSPLFLSWE